MYAGKLPANKRRPSKRHHESEGESFSKVYYELMEGEVRSA